MIYRGSPADIATLKIGDSLFRFDSNRRVYAPIKPGESFASGGPIYREHFSVYIIVNETKGSWIVDQYAKAKVNKKTLEAKYQIASRGFFTKAAMEDDIWLHENRYELSQLVQLDSDVSRLRRIANEYR